MWNHRTMEKEPTGDTSLQFLDWPETGPTLKVSPSSPTAVVGLHLLSQRRIISACHGVSQHHHHQVHLRFNTLLVQ